MTNVIDFIEFAKGKDAWLRNPIKNGGERCGSCPYFDICHSELSGMNTPTLLSEMTLTVKTLP